MTKAEIRILIVEDDPTQGQSLQQAFKRVGYDPTWVTNAEEALNQSKMFEFQLALVDCMLPKVNGVDLSRQLRKQAGESLKIIFTSGIMKDPNFFKKAIKDVNGLDYVTKPFDLEKLIKSVDEHLADLIEDDRGELTQLFSAQKSSLEKKLESIQASNPVHGFNLPYIIYLLAQSDATGVLEINSENSPPSSISFYGGKIIQVHLPDTTSYMGVLLVEMGFTSSTEVESSLSSSGQNKPIGQKLIEAGALSPHAVQVVMQEQMAIRLSKIIKDASFEVNFKNQDLKATEVSLRAHQLPPLIADWISSKFTREFLSQFFQNWLDHPVKKLADLVDRERLGDWPALKAAEQVLSQVDGSRSADEILSQFPEEDSMAPFALYYLLITQSLSFGGIKKKNQDFAGRLQRLKRLEKEREDANYFGLLGLPQGARGKDVHRAYHDLAKYIHPDRIEPEAPQELRDIAQRLFARISEAYQVLSNDEKRKTYMIELERGRADELLESEEKFETAKDHLLKGRYKEAHSLLKELRKVKGVRADVNIYYVWARVKVGCKPQDKMKLSQKLTDDLARVPSEDRHNAHYFYAKGLLYAFSGQPSKARIHLSNAINVDPKFAHAKRELINLKGKMDSEKTGLTKDITQVMSLLFGGKKKAG